MPSAPPPSAPESSLDKKKIVLAALVFLLVIALCYVLYWYLMKHWAVPALHSAPTADALPTLQGQFLMTLKPTVPENSAAGIYRANASDGTIDSARNDGDYFTPSLSTDGRIAVVANDGEDLSRLIIAKIDNPEEKIAVTPPSPALFAGASRWSADNMHIVYEAITALPSVGDTDIANSRVILLDPETDEQIIVDIGTSPIFAPDNSILYVKSDGVYRIIRNGMNVATTSERILFFEEYDATRNSRIALSPDGTVLVVTHPDISIFMTHDILDAETFALSDGWGFVQTIVWPTFSADGSSLAFIDIVKTNEGIFEKSLAVINLGTEKQRTVLNLDAYNDLYLSLSAWTE